jgi:hypothetical protein
LHTVYPQVVWHVRQLISKPIFGQRVEMIIDLTGVGGPVADIFHDQGLRPQKVTITAGFEEVQDEHDRKKWMVPKLVLVSRVQALLHDNRLQIHKALPDTAALVAELQDFRAHVTDSGRWTFGARSGQHDDLVLALSLACWWGARDRMGLWWEMGRSEPGGIPDLAPGPGEVAVKLNSRVWVAGRNMVLEPGWQVLKEGEAAALTGYID